MRDGELVAFWSSEAGGVWKTGRVVEAVGAFAHEYGHGAWRFSDPPYIRIEVGRGVFIIRAKRDCRSFTVMDLPIDIVPNSRPPRFKWKHVVDTPDGKRVIDQEGSLPPSMETAVARLITIAKQLLMDNAALCGKVEVLEKAPAVDATKTAGATAGKRKG